MERMMREPMVVQPIAPTDQRPIEDVARDVNSCLGQESKCRVRAALMLRDLRHRVDAGEAGKIGWQAWCEANIERSYRDVQRLLRLAEHSNPDEALEQERARNRVDKQASRGEATDCRPNAVRLEQVKKLIRQLPLSAVIELHRTWLPDHIKRRELAGKPSP